MEFGLLGPLVVRDGTRTVTVSAPQQRVLLAALLLNAGRVVSLDALAEVLWDGESPAGARSALHSAVQRLRATLGPSGADLIETQPPGYLITLEDGQLDVRAFGMLASRGHAAAEAGRWTEAADQLRQALGLWRGEPLADVPSLLLRDREVPPIVDQRLQALATRIDADLQLGRHGEVVAELRQLVAAHPLQEQFHAQLMLSLYRSGRQADALAAFQDVRRVLADELGIDPGPELTVLHQRILAADSELLRPDDAEPPGPAKTDSTPTAAAGRRNSAAAQDQVAPRQLPAATRHFAGRAGALKTLAGLAGEATGGSTATVIAVIDGTAGIGKTTLALHFAHQVADRFPDGQLYVNLRGFDPAGPPMPPAEAIRLLLDALSVPSARIPSGLEAQSGLYRSVLADKRILVLLDNARDVEQVRPLLPASPGCLVIVTSRSQLTPLVAAEGASPLTLDVLAEADAHELLARRLGAERVAGDLPAADELIQLCAGLPLALSIAAARSASQPALSLAALSAELRGAGGRLDALDAGHAAANVRAVLSWSYQQLNASAGRLFRLLGLHAGPDISTAAAARLAELPPDDDTADTRRADPGPLAVRVRAGPVRQPRPAPGLRGRADPVRGQRGRAARGHRPDARPLPAHGGVGGAAAAPHPAAGHPGLGDTGGNARVHRRRRAGAGLVPGRTPGPGGGRRAGRGGGLRCARLADPVGHILVSGNSGSLARVDDHRADLAGRRAAAG